VNNALTVELVERIALFSTYEQNFGLMRFSIVPQTVVSTVEEISHPPSWNFNEVPKPQPSVVFVGENYAGFSRRNPQPRMGYGRLFSPETLRCYV
jgi:hypothetical protein